MPLAATASPKVDLRVVDRAAERVVKEIGIPPCPKVLIDVTKELRAEDPDYANVARLIGTDAGLASAVIATVNSPFYGLERKIKTVRDGCAYLGLRSTALLVTGLLLRRAFPAGNARAMEHFWALSTATAWNAGIISRHLRIVDRDLANTYGLFRDCGLAVLQPSFNDYLDILDSSAGQGTRPITEIEDERYGVNHARVGYLLAESWQLPDTICTAIAHHHDNAQWASVDAKISGDGRKLVAVGILAEQLYWSQSRSQSAPEWELAKTLAFAELGLGEKDVADLAIVVKASHDKS
ncbi:MAG: HDOD domain-containing protein [Burkholderiales bacterium]